MLIYPGLKDAIQVMTSDSNRWRGVECAGWVALGMGIASALLFWFATLDSSADAIKTPVPSFLYPYLAALSVFVTICSWILWAARPGVTDDLISKNRFAAARIWFWRTFFMIGLVLQLAGLAGKPGANAVNSLNWYLFGPFDRTNPISIFLGGLGLPFSVFAALSNALALGTVAYLGVLCHALVLSCPRSSGQTKHEITLRALHIGEAARRLSHYLVMASALMVSSTLTLYLLFASADQIQRLQSIAAKTVSPQISSAEVLAVPSERGRLLCSELKPPATQQVCVVDPSPATPAKQSSSAAYMSLVAGLSFTGVLFVLFMSCSVAIDDRTAELTREAVQVAAAASDPFNLKTWREDNGLSSGASSGQVMQALTLTLPALTGLLTLISG